MLFDWVQKARMIFLQELCIKSRFYKPTIFNVTHFPIVIVKSTTETSGVGTLKAIPVNFPLKLGITFPTAFAAPVDDGMMF
jgi:hypothetical protein